MGVELYGDVALLRSLAVAQNVRGQGCGRRLVQEAEQYASRNGVKRLYLLTTTAEAFFRSLGYAGVERDAAPSAIRATSEFSALCSDTAALMAKEL